MGGGDGNTRSGDTYTANKQQSIYVTVRRGGKEGNDNECTGVENDGEITGVDSNNEITVVDSDNESAESGSTGSTDKADKLALIEEDITEAERDIAEATDLLAGTETEK